MSNLRREFLIINQRGLHARASAKFVKCAEGFDAEVQVSKDGQSVPGTSIMGLMMLAASMGTSIDVEASGPRPRRRSMRWKRWSPPSLMKTDDFGWPDLEAGWPPI